MQTGLATILAAGVLYVAWQQWKLAERKLKSELFDRRYRVFEEAQLYMQVICSTASTDLGQLSTFLQKTGQAHFLFGDDIVSYLNQIRLNAVQLAMARELMHSGEAGDPRPGVREKWDAIRWFNDQLGTSGGVIEKFKPYLSLDHDEPLCTFWFGKLSRRG